MLQLRYAAAAVSHECRLGTCRVQVVLEFGQPVMLANTTGQDLVLRAEPERAGEATTAGIEHLCGYASRLSSS